MGGMVSVKAHPDLLRGVLFQSQRRQSVQREIAALQGLGIGLETAAAGGTQKENFAHLVGINREVVLFPVLNCDHQAGGDLQPGFVPNFLLGTFLHGQVYIHPAPGQ